MAKMGRPRIEFTKDQKEAFEVLMGIPFVTCEIISTFFKVGESTLVRWIKREYKCTFDDLKEQKQGNLKLKLAGKQFEMAMRGNVPMAIWLGKQWLGQSEKIEQKIQQRVEEFKIGWADETDPADSST